MDTLPAETLTHITSYLNDVNIMMFALAYRYMYRCFGETHIMSFQVLLKRCIDEDLELCPKLLLAGCKMANAAEFVTENKHLFMKYDLACMYTYIAPSHNDLNYAMYAGNPNMLKTILRITQATHEHVIDMLPKCIPEVSAFTLLDYASELPKCSHKIHVGMFCYAVMKHGVPFLQKFAAVYDQEVNVHTRTFYIMYCTKNDDLTRLLCELFPDSVHELANLHFEDPKQYVYIHNLKRLGLVHEAVDAVTFAMRLYDLPTLQHYKNHCLDWQQLMIRSAKISIRSVNHRHMKISSSREVLSLHWLVHQGVDIQEVLDSIRNEYVQSIVANNTKLEKKNRSSTCPDIEYLRAECDFGIFQNWKLYREH
jgi:hypothetical protein